MSRMTALPEGKRSSDPVAVSTGWRTRVLFIAGGSVFSLLLAEGVIRVVEAAWGPIARDPLAISANDVKRGHPVLDYEYVPGITGEPIPWPEHPKGFIQVHVNNLGLRMDRDVSRKKPAGTFRILALGDSQTAGIVDNPDSWPNRLESLLRTSAAAPLEVLNAGVTGYTPMQEYLRWRLEGRALSPDLVILGYYTGNDFFDTGRGRLVQDGTGAWTLDEQPHPPPGPQGLERVFARSRIYAVCVAPFRKSAFEGFNRHPPAIDSPAFREKYSGLYRRSRRECVGCFSQSLLQEHLLLVGYPAERQEDRNATKELLRRLKQETAGAAARFVLLLIPSKLQIEGDSSGRAERMAKDMGLPGESLPFENEVRKELLAIGEELGLTVVDPLDALLAARAGSSTPFFYDADWHLNVAGNEAFARIMAVEMEGMIRPGAAAASAPPPAE